MKADLLLDSISGFCAGDTGTYNRLGAMLSTPLQFGEGIDGGPSAVMDMIRALALTKGDFDKLTVEIAPDFHDAYIMMRAVHLGMMPPKRFREVIRHNPSKLNFDKMCALIQVYLPKFISGAKPEVRSYYADMEAAPRTPSRSTRTKARKPIRKAKRGNKRAKGIRKRITNN